MAYTSAWLTHFVGCQQPTDDARCDLLAKILRECTLGQWEQQGSVLISPGTMLIPGVGGLSRNELIKFRPVCFCDIPEEHLRRHTTVYGRFGLAFKKDFLVAKGANPVFYVANGSLACCEPPAVPPLTLEDIEADAHAAIAKHFQALRQEPIPVRRSEFLDRLVADLMRVLPPPWPKGTQAEAVDAVREVQHRVLLDLLRHVFAFMKFFDESLLEEDPKNFYMEREWRVADFVSFELDDVQTAYVAPGFRARIEHEFPEIRIQELTF
jgi:hypothetical protein